MQRQLLSRFGLRHQRLRHHCESAAYASETAGLREAAELDCVLASAFDLENRMRNRRVGDVGLIRGIVKQDGFMLPRIINPRFQLLARSDRTRRIVRKTEV